MIRVLDEPQEWSCLIAEGVFAGSPCRVGAVIGRHVQGDVTLFLRVRLLVGGIVRLSPDQVTRLGPGTPSDLIIPPVPAGAVVTCDTRIS